MSPPLTDRCAASTDSPAGHLRLAGGPSALAGASHAVYAELVWSGKLVMSHTCAVREFRRTATTARRFTDCSPSLAA